MIVFLCYIFITNWTWEFYQYYRNKFISTHTPIQGSILVFYKYLLLLCALFYYFVWTSSSSQIKEWFHWSFRLMVFQFEFDLHKKVIPHYERGILVPYYHSCQVKFKRVPIIVFQTHCTQTQAHIHLHTSLRELDIGFLFKFS